MTFQAAASRQGRQFTTQCNDALSDLGFQLLGTRSLSGIGVELDQVGITPTRKEIWFEFKGSFRGRTPGMRRTDTAKKAIANGALIRSLADARPFVVLTSHLPQAGAADAMLKTALTAGFIDLAVSIYEPGWEKQLQGLF